MATAFTFGAFGDFVSIVELVVRGLKSLSASSGSSYDYQCLIQELLALRRILRILAAATLTNIEVTTVDGLIAEVECCHDVVERIWKEIRRYNKSLGAETRMVRRGVVTRVVDGIRAVEWELFKKSAVREAQKKLDGHVGRLNTFINTCNLSRLNEIWEHDAEHSSSIQAVATQVKELAVVMRQRPARVGYGPANGIMFDLFGSECIFPESFCRSSEQISAITTLLSTAWPQDLKMKLDLHIDGFPMPEGNFESGRKGLLFASNAEPDNCRTVQPQPCYAIMASLCSLMRLTGGGIAVQMSGKSLQIVICPNRARMGASWRLELMLFISEAPHDRLVSSQDSTSDADVRSISDFRVSLSHASADI